MTVSKNPTTGCRICRHSAAATIAQDASFLTVKVLAKRHHLNEHEVRLHVRNCLQVAAGDPIINPPRGPTNPLHKHHAEVQRLAAYVPTIKDPATERLLASLFALLAAMTEEH